MRLYKYLNQQNTNKFFSSPALRITPKECLNDPFEFQIHQDDLKSLRNIYETKENRSEIDVLLYKNICSHGVICLTESNDNLLMWSHYAEEHRGAVYALEVPLDSPSKVFLNKDDQGITLTSVRYRKSRRSTITATSENEAHNIILHCICTKSLEWIYEQEWRFIAHFSASDFILIPKDSTAIENIICSALNKQKFEISDYPDDSNLKYVPAQDFLQSNEGYEALEKLWLTSKVSRAMFFKLINPAAIREIYLGLHHKNEFPQRPPSGWPKLTQSEIALSIYKATKDENEFSLKFINHRGILNYIS